MSKFLKFKPVLTTDETMALLEHLTGEPVEWEDIRDLWHGYHLTPIIGYGSRLVGFDEETADHIFAGGKAVPQAESRIGIVSNTFAYFADHEGCLVNGTNGEKFFFFKDVSYGREIRGLKEEFRSNDLSPASAYDIEGVFYAYEEVYRLACIANDETKLPLLPKISPLQVRFLESRSSFTWPLADQLYGLQTESGTFSISVATFDALNDDKGRKQLHPNERRSAGRIIAALAAMAELDLAAPYKAVDPLRKAAACHGIELPNSDETIVKFFKDAMARSSRS